MARPEKPDDKKVSLCKGNYYLTKAQKAKVALACERQGGASESHILRLLIHRHIDELIGEPKAQVNVSVTPINQT